MAIDTTSYKKYDGQDAAELVIRPALERAPLANYFDIKEGIKGKQSIWFIEQVQYGTQLDEGCGLGAEELDTTINGESWEPVDLKLWKYECWKNLRGKVFEWSLKSGNDKPNLDGTDYIDYMLELISNMAFDDLVRMAWFADKDMTADDVNDPKLVKYFKTFNGIWKRVFDAKAAGKLGGYVPMEDADGNDVNDNTDNPGQELPEGFALKLFGKMHDKQPLELLRLPEAQRMWLCTRSLYNNYRNSLEGDRPATEAAYTMLTDGKKVLTFRGIPLQIVDEWDLYIQGAFTKTVAGKKVADLPHRSLLTQKGNFQLGFDTMPIASPTDRPLRVWNNEDTERWNAKLLYVADAGIGNKNIVVASY